MALLVVVRRARTGLSGFSCLPLFIPFFIPYVHKLTFPLPLPNTNTYHKQEVYNNVNSELPPPYYAVAFALVLLVVSGIQQLSLGNVFDEEEKSASSSGAVARRLALRNRSFFKNKK